MADIPLFPSKGNVDTFRDFVNVQKENLDLLLAQKREYEQIGRINIDVEKRIVQRRQSEKRMLDLIQRKVLEYEIQKEKFVTATSSAEREHARRLMQSARDQISHNRKLIELYRETNAIEIDMAKRKYEDEHKYVKFATEQGKKLLGIQVDMIDTTTSLGEEFIKLGVRGELFAKTLGATLAMLVGAYNLFNKLDKAAWEFRKAMGMTRVEAAVIRRDVQRIAIDNMAMGVTIESTYAAYKELGKTVGGVHNVTKAMAEDVAIMSAQLGISEDISAGFLRNMAAISKNSMESQTSMMYVASNMAAAAGVPLQEVMKNVGDRSKQTLTMMSRVPSVALRSAIELQRMGSSLKEAAASSRHILDFTENVNEEMEASVLLGRSINLQRAREMAYRRDLEGSTKEILRISKSVNFENLDVFQQEAFAKATGKSVDELLRMLQTDRQLERVKRAGTPEQKAQLALYEKMRKENEAAAKARAKDASVLLRTMNNQTRLAAISAKWNALLAKAQEFLLPIVDRMLDLVLPAMDVGMAIAKWSAVLLGPFAMLGAIGKVMYKVGHGMNMIVAVGSKLSGFFSKMANIGLKLMAPWSRISSLVGMVLGKLGFFGKFLGFFGKLLGPIGWVITAFQAIGGFIKGWNSTTGSWLKKLGGGLMGVLRAIIPGFDWILKMVKGLFGGIWKMFKAVGAGIWAGLKFYFLELPKIWWTVVKWIGKMWWEGVKMYIKMWVGLGKVIWNVIKWIGKMAWEGVKAYFNLWKHAANFVWNIIKTAGKMAWEGIKAYFNMWKSLGGLVYDGAKYLGKQIIKGIKSVKEGVQDAITWPFRAAWGGIRKLWGGKSPSEVGLSILKGISSVGVSISDSLTAPFRKAFAWILDKVPGMGKMAEKLRGGVKGAIGSVERRATAAYVPAVTVSPTGTKLAPFTRKPGEPGKGEKESTAPMTEATGQKICSLLEKILAKDNNIKMDGQLLSSHLARQTEFRGGYGVNKVA